MGHRHHKPKYTVIKTETFIQKLNELGKMYGRTVELVNGIEWALSRHPHKFEQLADNYYYWVTESLTNVKFPTVKILYVIDPEKFTVTLLAVEEK